MQRLAAGGGLAEPVQLGGRWLFNETPASSWDEVALPPPVDSPGWRPMIVPGAWEVQGIPVTAEGPFWYRRDFDCRHFPGERLFLRFRGVSTRCRILLNGRLLGEHEGIWDGFETEITAQAVPGRNELAMLVQKAGESLPLREAVAGFLPDVCVLFGGPWQPVELCRKRGAAIEEVHLQTAVEAGRLNVRVKGGILAGSGPVRLLLAVSDPTGREVAAAAVEPPADPAVFAQDISLAVPDVARWNPDEPNLYTLVVEAEEAGALSDRAVKRFGWRTVRAEGCRIMLNDRPLMLRGLLHWGWYPETVAPVPTRDQIRRELLAAKEAGFNAIKHCLYVPVEEYFALADELGVLLWQELPLWLPRVTPALKEKVYRQYSAIMERLHNHPSLILWSLGCELDATADGEFLARLYAVAKESAGEALVRDNSGSGECYGGLLREHADYYDYHFYTDPHFYRPLMDRFAADWRERKPWLYGEFCDQDVVRDIRQLREAHGGKDPWWLLPPAVADLKRERRGYAQESERLEEAGLLGTYEDLLAASRQKDLVYRRTVVEAVRQYEPLAGYVLTSLRDTPLTTSAFFDDFGRTKHPPSAWRRFNADTVLTLAWDNRRNWVHGGDRLRHWDHYNYLCGQTVRAHVVLSHFGREEAYCARLAWRLTAGTETLAHGAQPLAHTVAPGTVAQLAVVEFVIPDAEGVTPCLLHVEVDAWAGNTQLDLVNSWPLWFYPPEAAVPPPGTVLHDPYDRLPGSGLPPWFAWGTGDEVLVSTAWDESTRAFLAVGGRVLYVQPDGGPLPSRPMPFWREALQVFADPTVFAGFTGDGYCGLQWYSLATDRSFYLPELQACLGPQARLRPLLRRLDVREYLVTEYALEAVLGAGRAILTTLRLAGGLGDQATDLSCTVAGRVLLARLAGALAGEPRHNPARNREHHWEVRRNATG
ncbi:MAG: glycoside hydrolase family 2 protein [Bacteroidota bacterium]